VKQEHNNFYYLCETMLEINKAKEADSVGTVICPRCGKVVNYRAYHNWVSARCVNNCVIFSFNFSSESEAESE
jgi:uncharacterized C2H2 Zn-finger protein